MKVLFITTIAGSPWGGSEILWSNMAEHYLDNGHQVVVSIYDWGVLPTKVEKLKAKGLIVHKRSRTHYTRITDKIKGKIKEKTVSKFEFRNLLNIKPDVVFFSQGAAFDLGQPLFSNYISKLRVPYFTYLSLNTEYEVLSYDSIVRQKKIFENAAAVIFVSKRNMETAQRQLCSELSNAIVINNPLTFKDLSEVEMPSYDVIKFAMVARLDAYVKGHPILLKILSDEKWKGRNWELNIYGEGPDKEYIKSLIDFYKLQDRVKMIGQVSDIKNDIWKNNHVLLMPSQYEGCPISLYDAAICERTSIVSNVGGNAEFVIDNENGYIAEAPSVKSFGDAMEKLWQNKDRISELSINARNRALSILDLKPELTVIHKVNEIVG
jgi:glycosyltransferase involved in cell wall biosynthesis